MSPLSHATSDSEFVGYVFVHTLAPQLHETYPISFLAEVKTHNLQSLCTSQQDMQPLVQH